MMDRVLSARLRERAVLRQGVGVLLLALNGLGAARARAEVVTLAEVERRAQRDRAALVERQAGIARAQAEVDVAKSRSGPTLGARAEVALAPGGRLIEIETPPGSGETYFVSGSRKLGEEDALLPQSRYAAILSGKLTLLDFGRTELGVRAAEAALSAERASLLQAKVELVQNARAAYLAWLEAYQTWQLAARDADVARERSGSVRALIGEGARPATDATLTSYDEQLANLRRGRAERAAAAALRELSMLIHGDLPSSSEPDPNVLSAAPVLPPEPRGGRAGAPSSPAPGTSSASSLLRVLERQQQAAASAARAADRASSPALDVTADVGVQGQADNLFPVYRAGVSLSVPIWDGGLSSAQAAVRRAEARGLEARRQALQQRLELDEAAARDRLAAAAEDLRLSHELLATAELSLAQAEEHYRSGSDTLERVLNAQRSLVQARREVLTAQLEAARTRLELTPIRIEP